jgi:hypothetical protein
VLSDITFGTNENKVHTYILLLVLNWYQLLFWIICSTPWWFFFTTSSFSVLWFLTCVIDVVESFKFFVFVCG